KRESGAGTIENIKVVARGAALDETGDLIRCPFDADRLDLFGIILGGLQFLKQRGRKPGAAHFGETANLFVGEDRHDSRNDGNRNSGLPTALDECEIV